MVKLLWRLDFVSREVKILNELVFLYQFCYLYHAIQVVVTEVEYLEVFVVLETVFYDLSVG